MGHGFSHNIKDRNLRAAFQFCSCAKSRSLLAAPPALHFFFFAVAFSLEDFASLDFDSLDLESLTLDSAGFESEDLSADFAESPSPEPSADVAPEFLPL